MFCHRCDFCCLFYYWEKNIHIYIFILPLSVAWATSGCLLTVNSCKRISKFFLHLSKERKRPLPWVYRSLKSCRKHLLVQTCDVLETLVESRQCVFVLSGASSCCHFSRHLEKDHISCWLHSKLQRAKSTQSVSILNSFPVMWTVTINLELSFKSSC